MYDPINLVQEVLKNPNNMQNGTIKSDKLANLLSQLKLDDVLKIESAGGIDPHHKVTIIKSWIRTQDKMCSEISGNILYKQSVTADDMRKHLNLMKKPNLYDSALIVDNIFYQISTAGGSVPAVDLIDIQNPENSLIQFDHGSHSLKNQKYPFNIQNFEYESPEDFIIIGFPPFMKVKLTSYKIKTPSKSGGMKKFDIYGAKTANFDLGFDTIDSQNGQNGELQNQNEEFDFQIKNPLDKFFSFIKIKCTENYIGNNHVIFSKFDISGYIQIPKE